MSRYQSLNYKSSCPTGTRNSENHRNRLRARGVLGFLCFLLRLGVLSLNLLDLGLLSVELSGLVAMETLGVGDSASFDSIAGLSLSDVSSTGLFTGSRSIAGSWMLLKTFSVNVLNYYLS